MDYRKIERIYKNEHAHWVGNGFRVRQYFPANEGMSLIERMSPFILLDYNAPYKFKGTNSSVGVGAHPHKGFETVTFAFEGKVEHNDNRGNHGVIEPGDIQWMTAGSGIMHKEYQEKEYAKNDRIFHMIQLWVNLPKKYKNTEPKYQAIKADEMGGYEEDGLKATVYSGEVFGVRGPASIFSPINIYKLDIEDGKKISIKEPDGFNTALLVLSGDIKVNDDYIAHNSDFVLFDFEDKEFSIEGNADKSEVFVMSGMPIKEPIAAMGPFVMNTYDEIEQANIDFNNGKFGPFEF